MSFPIRETPDEEKVQVSNVSNPTEPSEKSTEEGDTTENEPTYMPPTKPKWWKRFAAGRQAGTKRKGGCLRGCLVALVIYVVFCFLIGLIFSWLFSTPAVKLEENTVYRLELRGTLVEQGQEANPLDELFESSSYFGTEETVGLDHILSNIKLAKNDDRILGIWLDGAEMSMAPASAKAIRDALLDFKSSGKWIIATAANYGQTNYYIASVADKICIDPTGSVNWNGLSAQKMYFTRLLEKIGVEMQILKVGTFKSAVEPYFCTEMSEADSIQTMQYLSGIWDEYKTAISKSRNIPYDQLDSLADRYMGLQPAEEQVLSKLVDTIMYAQDIEPLLRVYTGTEDYHTITTDKLRQVERPKSSAKAKVAVFYLEGEITDDSGNGIVGKDVVKKLKKIAKDEDVKALVLRVNSPGGSADASEQIWHAVENVKAKGIPVVVSMGDYAASGGYYISCGADYIYAEPTTLTGSIGIFGTVPNVSKVRDNIGLDIDGVNTNKHSALESNAVYQGMNNEEQELFQAMIERGYDLFTSRCAAGRHMEQDSIKSIAEGRVWLGKTAKDLGLVDEMGNIDDAVAKAVALAKMDDSYQLVYYPEVIDPIEELFKILEEPTEEERILLKMKEFVSKPRIMALMPKVIIK